MDEHRRHAALATAAIEQSVNHVRLAGISDLHPHDLSIMLARLEREGWLQSTGQSKGKGYFLPGTRPLAPEDVFSVSAVPEPAPDTRPARSGHSESRSGHSDSGSGHKPAEGASEGEPVRDGEGCLLTSKLDAPVIDSLSPLTQVLREELEARAALPRTRPRLDPEAMEVAILAVCTGRYLRFSALAELLNRNADSLRKNHLDRLVSRHAAVATSRLANFPSPLNGMNNRCVARVAAT